MYYTKLDSFTYDFIKFHEYKKEKKKRKTKWVADGVKFAFKTKMITFTDS